MHPTEGIRTMIDSVLKMIDCLFKMMDFVSNMMDFVLKMRDSVLKMMDFEGVHKRAPIRLWNLHPLHGRAQ